MKASGFWLRPNVDWDFDPAKIGSYERENFMTTNATSDQTWLELQDKVNELLRQSLAGNSFYRIEYKPGEVVHLLEMPPEYGEERRRGSR